MDYDKQFEEDLEKATALSLETLALDQFRRNRLQYSVSDVSSSTSIYKSTCKYHTTFILFVYSLLRHDFFMFCENA